MRTRFWFVSLGLVVAVAWLRSAAATEPSSTATHGPMDISLEPLLAAGGAAFIRDGGLFLVAAGTSQPILIRQRPENGLIFSPQLAQSGGRPVLAWIEPQAEGNRLLAAVVGEGGVESPLVVAGGIRSTLARLAAGPDSLVLVDAVTQGQPELSLALSRDGGRSFQRSGLPLAGIQRIHQVAIAVSPEGALIVVHGQEAAGPALALIRYPFAGEAGPLVERVAQTGLSPLVELLPLQASPAILFKDDGAGGTRLRIATKQGDDWSVATLPETEDLDVARLDRVVWPDGRALILFSGEHRGRDQQRVFASLSEDGGRTWRTTQLDSARFGNTRAWLPRAAWAGDRVAVVWEDSRDIRPRIRMQYSQDRGASWIAQDLTLSDPRRPAIRPRCSGDEAGISVAWHQFDTDARERADLALRRLGWGEIEDLAKQPQTRVPDDQVAQGLRESVQRYWQAMIDKDLETSYRSHDPFFRARMPFVQYAAKRGPMLYHAYRIEGMEILGTEAKVRLTVNYSVPRLRVMGETTSLPPRDFPIEEIWLRVDEVWTRKFVDAMSGGSAIQY